MAQGCPINDEFAIKPNEFCLASYLRLGYNLPFDCWLDTCDCGKIWLSLQTCKYGGRLV